jgi:hypothetical protein
MAELADIVSIRKLGETINLSLLCILTPYCPLICQIIKDAIHIVFRV